MFCGQVIPMSVDPGTIAALAGSVALLEHPMYAGR